MDTVNYILEALREVKAKLSAKKSRFPKNISDKRTSKNSRVSLLPNNKLNISILLRVAKRLLLKLKIKVATWN